MSDQLAFGDELGHWSTDEPETSRNAALDNYARSGTQRRRVFDAIERRGAFGATDDELAAELRLGLNSVRPRRNELRERELIEDSGKRRSTGTGSLAAVWIVSERGSALVLSGVHPLRSTGNEQAALKPRVA